MKLQGSLYNRMTEGNQFCDRIEVGTLMTEFFYTDRTAWEVIDVRDQKHVTVRELDHKLVGDTMTNDWELSSNPDNATRDMVNIGGVWYFTRTVTADELAEIEKDPEDLLRLCVTGYEPAKIRAKGKQTKRFKASVSFGIGQYHFDYEF